MGLSVSHYLPGCRCVGKRKTSRNLLLKVLKLRQRERTESDKRSRHLWSLCLDLGCCFQSCS